MVEVGEMTEIAPQDATKDMMTSDLKTEIVDAEMTGIGHMTGLGHHLMTDLAHHQEDHFHLGHLGKITLCMDNLLLKYSH